MKQWLLRTRVPLWMGFSLFGFLLRLPLLSQSLWLDEAAQALESARPWSQQFALAADFQPPLYHLWLFVIQQFGHSESWMRLASVLPGIASIALFTALAEKWFSRQAAFRCGMLMSASSLLVYFSQELRPYMFAVGWSSLAAYAFFELMEFRRAGTETPLALPHRRFWGGVFVLSNAALILSSYVGLFLLPAWIVAAGLVKKEKAVFILKCLLVSGLFFGAWYLGFREQLAVGSQLREVLPGWDQVVSLPQAKALFLTLGKFVVGRLPLDLTLLDLTMVALPLLLLAVGSGVVLAKSRESKIMVLGILFFLPLLISWLFSFFIPVLEPKRVLFLLPWLFLMVGVVSSRLSWGWIIGLSWLGLQIFGLVRYWQDPLLQREPWREAVAVAEETYQAENTVVIFGFDGPFAPWRWYQQENLSTLSTGLDPLDSPAEAQEALTGIERYENVIVFDYLRDLTDPQREIERTLVQKGFQEIAVWDYPNIGFVRLFYRQQLFAQRELL